MYGTQAGRLHQILDAAIPEDGAGAVSVRGTSDPVALRAAIEVTLESAPTAPKAAQPLDSLPEKCTDATCPCRMPGPIFDLSVDTANAKKPEKEIIHWRRDAHGRDDELNARTDALLQAIEAERQARLAAEHQPPAKIESPTKLDAKQDEASPAIAAMVILGAFAIGVGVCAITRKKTK